LICLYILLTNGITLARYLIDYEPLIKDTNVKKIQIKENIILKDLEYNLESLNIGDNYSTLYFNVDSLSGVQPIKGAKLYQNGKLLPYISAGSSGNRDSAIAFAPTDGYDNIELHFDYLVELIVNEYEYPLEFVDNKATVKVQIQDAFGEVIINLSEDSYEIVSKGLEKYEIKKEFGNRHPIVYILLKEDEALRDFSQSNKPTHLLIIYRESIYSGDTIIVPVS